ncbi:MAG: type II toxin-antitoxin system VapC family toxin [Kiritimatiellae bacterium]|jgi:PIN domain nuclease of toxin-antitoxin system|nr:type II toxin-antitoxin system VapC family toxin [Kiritimatiellia bacterium]
MTPTHVLDTCALLDLVTERWTASSVVDEFLESRHPVVLSISVWEIARKFALGKLTLPCDQEGILKFARDVCGRFRLTLEPVSEETCCYAECLPLHHRDPFDRMILARAALSGCPVITTDRMFDMYKVPILRHRR